MTKEECLQFTANALALAMERDSSSGGVICLASIERSRVAGTFGRPDPQIHHCHFTTYLNPGILRYNKKHPILTQNSINSL